MDKIRVVVVDEDVVWRDRLREALEAISDIEVAGAAPTGKIGLDKLGFTSADVVLLSSRVTGPCSEEFVREALHKHPQLGIVVTTLVDDRTGAENAVHAIEKGAFDFVVKPAGVDQKRMSSFREMLLARIRGFSIRRYSRLARGLTGGGSPRQTAVAVQSGRAESSGGVAAAEVATTATPPPGTRPEAVLIGASTGGPEALSLLIPSLPAGLSVPVLVVLHMPRVFTKPMAASLDRKSPLNVHEAVDGEEAVAGTVYLAPGGAHLRVESGTRRRAILRVVNGESVNGCKPSVDVLFESAAPVFRSRALAVVLTGMGSDGTKGLAELRKWNTPAVVQDRQSSVVWGMPGSAVRAGLVDEELGIEQIAQRIADLAGPR